MIMSKRELVLHFKDLEKAIPKEYSRHFIFMFNSHMDAFDKIAALENKKAEIIEIGKELIDYYIL